MTDSEELDGKVQVAADVAIIAGGTLIGAVLSAGLNTTIGAVELAVRGLEIPVPMGALGAVVGLVLTGVFVVGKRIGRHSVKN